MFLSHDPCLGRLCGASLIVSHRTNLAVSMQYLVSTILNTSCLTSRALTGPCTICLSQLHVGSIGTAFPLIFLHSDLCSSRRVGACLLEKPLWPCFASGLLPYASGSFLRSFGFLRLCLFHSRVGRRGRVGAFIVCEPLVTILLFCQQCLDLLLLPCHLTLDFSHSGP